MIMKKSLLTRSLSVIAITAFVISLLAFNSIQKPPAKWDIPEKYQKMKNPLSPKEGLNIGKMLYAKHCKACHGTKGKGDGPKAGQLKTKLPDLTSEAVKKQSDGTIYYQSIIGRDEMPNFEKKIPDEEDRWSLINYIKTLK